MPITTGQFFTNILLAAAPTALGRALAHLPATTADWANALNSDIANHITVEDASMVTELNNRLVTYQQIFAALLTPVFLPDGGGGFTQVPLAKVLNDQVALLGNTAGFLKVPWPNPPHPPGRFLWRLIDTLTPYDEQ